MTSMEHTIMKAVSTADTANSFFAAFASALWTCADARPVCSIISIKNAGAAKNSSGTAEKLAAGACAAPAKKRGAPEVRLRDRVFFDKNVDKN
jgi:hypothetical protein